MSGIKARKGESITVKINDEERTYKLRLTFAALEIFEDEAGEPLLAWAASFDAADEINAIKGMSAKKIRIFIGAALYGGGHELEPDEVREIIDEIGIIEVMHLFAKLVSGAFDAGKKPATAKTAKPKA